jgi:crotonobetainyl-CoA:carnitine CoA-transferase CaiB-like acyl-CoA transferase
VLDMSSNFAGPLACQILGDLGADVIKVEPPGRGEDTRSLPPIWQTESTVFRSVNRNKRSVALDVKDPLGRAALLRLGAWADVVVENFRPGRAEALGLGYERFRDANASLIYCAISAFGNGPLGRERPGYDALVQAFTGMMDLTGHPDSPPARTPTALIDLTTGLWAAIAIMAALKRREQTGAGERVEAVMVDAGFQLLSHQILGLIATGAAPRRTGSVGPSAAPYEAFQVADGWIMIAVANDRLFVRLCQALGLPELHEDSRFRTVAERVRNRESLHELIQERLLTGSSAVWIDLLLAAGVPAAPVNELRQALADPVTAERRILVSPDEAAGDAGLPLVRLPIDHRLEAPRRRPPKLGEHTADVLNASGFSADEVAAILRSHSSLEPAEV